MDEDGYMNPTPKLLEEDGYLKLKIKQTEMTADYEKAIYASTFNTVTVGSDKSSYQPPSPSEENFNENNSQQKNENFGEFFFMKNFGS